MSFSASDKSCKKNDETHNSFSSESVKLETDIPVANKKSGNRTCRNILALAYRNMLSKTRSWPWVILEILLPVLLSLVNIYLWINFEEEQVPAQNFSALQYDGCYFGAYGRFAYGYFKQSLGVNVTAESIVNGGGLFGYGDKACMMPASTDTDSLRLAIAPSRYFNGERLARMPRNAFVYGSLYFTGEGCMQVKSFFDTMFDEVNPYLARQSFSSEDNEYFRDDRKFPLTVYVNSEKEIPDENLIAAILCNNNNATYKFTIQMQGLSRNAVDTRDPVFSNDNFLSIHDGRASSSYYAGAFIEPPGKRGAVGNVGGGFLDIQALLYAYVFNKEGTRLIPVVSPTNNATISDYDSRVLSHIGIMQFDVFEEPDPFFAIAENALGLTCQLCNKPAAIRTPKDDFVCSSMTEYVNLINVPQVTEWWQYATAPPKFNLAQTIRQLYPNVFDFISKLPSDEGIDKLMSMTHTVPISIRVAMKEYIKQLHTDILTPSDIDAEASPYRNISSPDNTLMWKNGCWDADNTTIANITLSKTDLDNNFLLYTMANTLLNNWITQTSQSVRDKYTPYRFFENAMPAPDFQFKLFPIVYLSEALWGLLWAVLFSFPVYRALKSIMIDKESKTKETLKIIGVTDGVLWFSWYIVYAVYFAIYSGLMTLASFFYYPNSNIFLLYCLYYLFCLASVSFSVLISSLFDSTTTAGIFGLLIYFAMFTPFFITQAKAYYIPQAAKTFLMIFPPAALAYGVELFLAFEMKNGEGLNFSNGSDSFTGVSYNNVMIMLFVAFVLEFLVGWYIDKINPGPFGVPHKWYFPFTADFWKSMCIECGIRKKEEEEEMYNEIEDEDEYGDNTNDKLFEPVYDTSKCVIDVRRLSRKFKLRNHLKCTSETITAVDNSSFRIYESEIFALLGHNGAGKTTTISLMTGMISASEGTVRIMNRDMETETSNTREYVGFCPQHDILFPFMTVKEHLYMFSLIKGVPRNEIDDEILKLVRLLDMEEKLHALSKTLSGGQKRRLSVGMALTGGSKAVFLDEPSTGMDPYTRRALWNCLKEIKKSRAIILTTHLMEEADFLGDRICIMNGGQLLCVGTSLFLKQQLGAGYNMTFSKSALSTSQTEAALKEYITAALPGACLSSNVALEMSFKIPASQSDGMADTLQHLADNKQGFQYAAISVGPTKLEEVFLLMGSHKDTDVKQLTEEEEAHTKLMDETTADHEGDIFSRMHARRMDTNSWVRFWHQLRAVFIKNFRQQQRDVFLFMCQLVAPILFMLAIVGILSLIASTYAPRIHLSSSLYTLWPYRTLVPQPLIVSGSDPSADVMTNCDGNYGVVRLPDITTRQALDTHLIQNIGLGDIPRYTALNMEPGLPATVFAGESYKMSVFHNSSFTHSLPTIINDLANCMIQKNSQDVSVSIHSHSLPGSLVTTAISLFISVGFAFIPSAWGYNVVREKTLKSKQAQHIAGLPIYTYWIGQFAWDLVMYVLPAACLVAFLFIFEIRGLTNTRFLGCLILLIIMFAFGVAPFVYLLSLGFDHAVTCQKVLLFVNIFFPIVSGMIATIPTTAGLYEDVLRYILMLFPAIALNDGFFQLAFFATEGVNHWAIKLTGGSLVYLVIDFIVYTTILLGVDYSNSDMKSKMRCQAACRCGREENDEDDLSNEADLISDDKFGIIHSNSNTMQAGEDEDVVLERLLLQNKQAINKNKEMPHDIEHDETFYTREDAVAVKGLRKVFPASTRKQKPKVAVSDLWFAIKPGECFGFLGVNGAGKTTSCEMLNGLLVPTKGTAAIGGHDIIEERSAALACIGYCPQFDALLGNLTAEEHIYLYSRINMYKDSDINEFVSELCHFLALTEYQKRPTKGYSGGNKRKLSLGLSFLGDPKVVFLDEPSAGVDPAARRKLWAVIARTKLESGRCVILTTHSMDECEALCDRLTIMQGGKLRCLGTPSNLKSKYAEGIQLIVNLDFKDLDSDERTSVNDDFVKFCRETWPGAELAEALYGRQKWLLDSNSVSLSSVFATLELHKETLRIRDYSAADSDLEQVFINFQRGN